MSKVFSVFGAIGFGLAGIRSVPIIWQLNPLDAGCIAGACLYVILHLMLDAFGGETA